MFKFFEQLLDFIQHIGSKSAFHIFCNISRLARFEPEKLEHRVINNTNHNNTPYTPMNDCHNVCLYHYSYYNCNSYLSLRFWGWSSIFLLSHLTYKK